MLFRSYSEQARYWFMKSAEQENKEAQYLLGYIYFNGIDILTDYEKSFYWYKKSAEQHHHEHQYTK